MSSVEITPRQLATDTDPPSALLIGPVTTSLQPPALLPSTASVVLITSIATYSSEQGNSLATQTITITSTISPRSSDLDASPTQLVTSSQSPSPSTSLLPDTKSSLSAGAGAGIGIAVLVLLLAGIGGVTLFLWKRRRRLQARNEMSGHEGKAQLADTSVMPEDAESGIMTVPIENRHELEGASTPQLSPQNPAEVRAGPYSNRHELEGRHR